MGELRKSSRRRRSKKPLWPNCCRASADVKRIAQRHVVDVERRMAAMADMRDSLRNLVDCCQGDHRPDCPILDELADHGPPHGRQPTLAGEP